MEARRRCDVVWSLRTALALLPVVVVASSLAAPPITWFPASIVQEVPAGGPVSAQVSFVSSQDLSNVVVRVVPELAPYVRTNPTAFARIARGQRTALELMISVPFDTLPDLFDGAIQLRSGTGPPRVFARPLPVTLVVMGAIVGPAGGTVFGVDGTSITLPPGAIDYEVLMDIALLPLSMVEAATGDLPLVRFVEITFEPTTFHAHHLPPAAPLEISVPAPPGLAAGSKFIIGQQVLLDSIDDPKPGLREQLVPVDMAVLAGDNILTQAGIFPGIFNGGLFAVVQKMGSGFAVGSVSDASGPRPGVVVANTTNPLVAITDATGTYNLFISGGPFTVTGFDPFRGTSGSASGDIIAPDSTVTRDILLSPLASPPITRDGIRNGGFERGDVTSWGFSGAVSARQQLGPTSTGVIIRPTEGQWMADINTGTGAAGGIGASLKQMFIVPSGVRTLRFDFNFVSEEFPEFVGSPFDDTFRAVITTPSGEMTFAQVSVNQSGGFTLIGDCFFPGGDDTCGQTGWREGSVDLSAFAGTAIPITVELLFSAVDLEDDIFDTHVLVDNIRFSTVWVDAKIIQGANTNMARVRNEVLGATEILSQAGVNVQLRNLRTVADPGGLLDTDITWVRECRPALLCLFGGGTRKGVPTTEERQLMGLARSATATDVNVYYVRSFTGGSAGAFAVGPDDFHDINILASSGTIHPDVSGGCTAGGHNLAHELGHLLISPQSAADMLEHAAGTTNFMGGNCAAPVLGIVGRQQSQNINRVSAPLPVP